MNGTLGDVFLLLAKFVDFTMSPFSLILLRHRPSLFKIKLSLFMLCVFGFVHILIDTGYHACIAS